MFSVLYVDDEPALLEIGKLFLEQSGLFSVDTVTSAPEAVLAIGKKGYDAIISDYQMPEMNGIEFLKHVRGSGNTIPFIIFTGRGREEVVIQALNEGADFYLQKGGEPVSQFAELGHKVQMAVQQRRAETSIRDHERREADIINFLPDATFAIDTKGVVIAWNRAMERMTGVKSLEILGKGNFEYAIPFYHERRPVLIDLVLRDDPVTARKYPAITQDGTTLFSEITISHFNNGQGAALWFTASPLFDTRGTIVGAIESIREITERKQAEEALYESEKRFRDLSDLQPQVVYEADTKMNLTYANQVTFEWVGYTEDEFRRGLNLLKMIAPKDRERATVDFHAILEGKGRTGTAGEYLALRKDGTEFPITIYSSPIIVNGRITGLRGIIIDITERKKSDNDLKNTVAFLNSLIDQSPTPMWISNEKGILILINKACCDLLHIDEADVVGKYSIFEDTIIIEQGFLPLVREVFEKGIVARFQIKYDTKQLKNLQLDQFVSLILDETIFPVRDTNGKITNAVIQHTNVTERKRAEQTLADEATWRKILISQSRDGIVILDNNGKVFEANQRFAEMLGYSSDEVHTLHVWDWDTQIEREKLLEMIRTIDEAGDHFETHHSRKDGTVFDVEISTNAAKFAGEKLIFCVCRDITERKRAEQAIREANKKINLLTSITRHDVANQVSILRGFAKIAKMKEPDPVVVELLEKIDTVGSTIARQIEFTKVYQELGKHSPGWQRISEIVAQQKTEGISQSCTCNAEVFADPMLEKVFFNLIENAARHGERVTTIRVSCRDNPDDLVIIVEDNGAGVPPGLKEKIFEKGFGKHTGFGLFLAREILAITGITIRETGEHGKGARFEITVPKGSYRIASS